MSVSELKKLGVILAKLESLQNQVSDGCARDKMGRAKDELLRLWNEEFANALR